jgi:glycosyltransferase involved in cell wall biosynthesis
MTVQIPCYVVVTPVRDEEAYLPFTIESMVKQSIRPAEWIIVDDGSKDRTGEIIDEAARKYSWIRRCNRTDRGFRKPGAGIIEAFYAGFDALSCRDWEYMAKLDGDLSFAPTYFEEILSRFERDQKLGIAGGTLFHITDGQRELETCPTFHVRGGAKIFRRACWDAIQGLWVGYGSDTIDEVQANMLDWKTMSMADLLMQHHRFTGASYGRWGALVKDGKGDYASGYHPLFLIAKCIRRLIRKPVVIGSAGLMYGYLISYLQNLPRVDPPVRKYIRREQLARLTGRPSIWK